MPESPTAAPDLNLWLGRAGLQNFDGADQFIRLAEAVRTLHDTVAAARPTARASAEAAEQLEALANALGQFAVDESDQVAARLLSSPGRGQTLLPPFHLDSWHENSVRGRIRFSRHYLGSNGAAHGGAVSLFFDDLLGQLANVPGSPRARTAYIRVDYRQITPLDRDLSVVVDVSRRDGRKITIVGELRDGPTVLAVAEGLFVTLRDGQP